MIHDLLVVGGGAAGFYAAASLREECPDAHILILERGKEVLSKVRISGGGRCNVTHAEFEANALIENYPRGEKELRGPFHRYGPADTLAFFEERGVALKTEEDGRIFPVSDRSQTIIDCLTEAAQGPNTTIQKSTTVDGLSWHTASNLWVAATKEKEYKARFVLLSTGSSPKAWAMLEKMGIEIVPPVPSLFTFQINHPLLQGLAGISQEVALEVQAGPGQKPVDSLRSSGPLLITHKGVSGPAVLRLSAWGALELNALHYQFVLHVNWLPHYGKEELMSYFQEIKQKEGRKMVCKSPIQPLTKRLWLKLCEFTGMDNDKRWADLSGKEMEQLASQLLQTRMPVSGKNTFKEEFVTAGGIHLKEVDFRTFQSKRYPQLYFAGEVLNIDAITGGFNFQNAWTGGRLAALHMAKTLQKSEG